MRELHNAQLARAEDSLLAKIGGETLQVEFFAKTSDDNFCFSR
jgi:hypothetical protein